MFSSKPESKTCFEIAKLLLKLFQFAFSVTTGTSKTVCKAKRDTLRRQKYRLVKSSALSNISLHVSLVDTIQINYSWLHHAKQHIYGEHYIILNMSTCLVAIK